MARWARVVVPEFRGWVDKVQWTGQVPPPQGPLPTVWDQLSYVYDPAGRRIEKKYDGTTVVKYLYDGGHYLAEYDGSNNLLRKYLYGPCVDEPISMIDVEHDSATYYYHFDGLGSVIALTNSSGTTAVLYEYSVYGQVAASDPNHPNRFMFTGREFDKETGLYYYRARYYNPEIGRFLQTDPTGYGDGMNLYRYCRNNALNLRDALGTDPVPDPETGGPANTPFYVQNFGASCAAATIQNVLYMLWSKHADWKVPDERIVRLALELAMGLPNPTGYSQNWQVRGAGMDAVGVVLNNFLAGTDIDIRYKELDPGTWDMETMKKSVEDFNAPFVFALPPEFIIGGTLPHCMAFVDYEEWATHTWNGQEQTTSWCWVIDPLAGQKIPVPECVLDEMLRSGSWSGYDYWCLTPYQPDPNEAPAP